MITRELVGISRSDASVAPTGVCGCLKAWITCGDKENYEQQLYDISIKKKHSRVTRVLLCCPLNVKNGTVGTCDMQVGDTLHL